MSYKQLKNATVQNMKMLKILIILSSILSFQSLIAQPNFSEFIDSSIRRDQFTKNDWAIGLTIERWDYPTVEPPLERNTTIVIYEIEDTFYLQKFIRTCYEDRSCYYASKSIILAKDIALNYTIDSINQAENDHVYQYIYKFDTLGTSIYVCQGPGSHSPNYIMHFKTKNLDISRQFDNISFTEKLFEEKNLNFLYNSRTFVYRGFLKFTKFLEEHRTILPK